MKKAKLNDGRLLDGDINSLIQGLNEGEYFPRELLGNLLMEFYDVANKRSNNGIYQVQAKVLDVLKAVKLRGDESSKHAYNTYAKTYQSLCLEFQLPLKPAGYKISEIGAFFQTRYEEEKEPNSEDENGRTDKKSAKLLSQHFSKFSLDIQNGKLDAEEFLGRGLCELEEMAKEIPFHKRRFLKAMNTYDNVMSSLEGFEDYSSVENFRSQYTALLKRVFGSAKPKRSHKCLPFDSRGIGRKGFESVRDPSKDFKKSFKL